MSNQDTSGEVRAATLCAVLGLDSLPHGWVATSLSALARRIDSGFACGREMQTPDGVIHLRPNNIAPEGTIDISSVIRVLPALVSANTEPDDVLFNNTNSPLWVGKTALADSTVAAAAFSNHITRIQLSPEGLHPYLLSRFLNYLRESGYFARNCKRHINQASISRIFLSYTMSVPLPPLGEQKRLVARLSALERRIGKARTSLRDFTTLVATARQSILTNAFTGKLTEDHMPKRRTSVGARKGSSRDSADSGDISDATLRIIPGRATLSVGNPQTAIPLNWRRVRLTDIARLESGHTPSRQNPEYWGGNIKWMAIPDAKLHSGQTINDTASRITEEGLANSSARILPKGTVCISRTASIGYAVILGEPMATSQDFANWVCTSDILPEFLMFAFIAEGDHLNRFGKGTTHTTIYFTELKGLYITLPPIEEQRKIVKLTTGALNAVKAIEANHAELIQTIDRLSKALLRKAFRGELTARKNSDESATSILERLSSSKIRGKSTPKKFSTNFMKHLTSDTLRPIIQQMKSDSFNFSELRAAAPGRYDDLAAALFVLLQEEKPLLRQCFDKSKKEMHFERLLK